MAFSDQQNVTVHDYRDNNRRFKDRFAKYDRGSVIDELPFFGVVLGARRTGKSVFLSDMMQGNIPPVSFDYDRYVYFSDSSVDGVSTTSYRDLTMPRGREGQHSLVIFDDPPMENMEFRTMLNELARNGRHQGMSVLTTFHAI